MKALAEHAENWGAEWTPRIDGGEIKLPVTAGLRRGVIAGRITLERHNGASRATLDVNGSEWTINRTAVGILLSGALGGLVLILLPFFPKLLQLMPIAVMLSLAAWFLVVSRLRSSGAEEFLDDLALALTSDTSSAR